MYTETATYKLPACSSLPILRRDDYAPASESVETLQERLNHFGFSLKVDGFFGKNTEKAVLDFQSRSEDDSFPVDGIVGPLTWAALGSCKS